MYNKWLHIDGSPARAKTWDLRINSPPLSGWCLQLADESLPVFQLVLVCLE
jgi:hypothetical protein